ncbi:uncharacterized protein LOC141819200 [Curcuma longa]|uniref:uncharacterized protein LOC141819200 n=1 Tax=Curcuma longa TaxID=136217 RepID=UPI003D9E385D
MLGEREEKRSTPPSHTSGELLAMTDDACGGSANGEEFEFAFVIKDPEAGPEITANELFSNGQIRTIYPVFGSGLLLEPPLAAATNERTTETKGRRTLRRLFIEEREEDSSRASSASSSSSSAGVDELDGVPEGTYCVWAPAPSPSQSRRGKKSKSTGSSLRWRLRELVTVRSHSDGREKIVLLAGAGPAAAAAAEEVTEGEEEKEREGSDEGKGIRAEEATAGRSIYVNGEPAEKSSHRLFLPAGGGPRRSSM